MNYRVVAVPSWDDHLPADRDGLVVYPDVLWPAIETALNEHAADGYMLDRIEWADPRAVLILRRD